MFVKALSDLLNERVRQNELKAQGRFLYTCADRELAPAQKLAVLAEEFGEVARATLEVGALVNDGRCVTDAREALRKELVQVAAVAMAWVEGLDAEATANAEDA